MMKKKLLLLFAILAMAVSASAENTVIYYTSLNEKVVTPQTDAFKDAKGNAVTFTNNYADGQGTLTFDGIVTSIGEEAFKTCSSLTLVTIPNSVTSIGNRAFVSCSSLTSVTIPNSVTSIGERAFEYCGSLTSVDIPNSVTSIGERAFVYCRSLIAFYGKYASSDNRCLIIEGTLNSFAPYGLITYSIPNFVTSIGDYAFSGCASLTSVTIPNSVTSIGEYAFYYCRGLTSVTIPNSVTSIGDSALYGCSGLTSVTIPNSVTSIGDSALLIAAA